MAVIKWVTIFQPSPKILWRSNQSHERSIARVGDSGGPSTPSQSISCGGPHSVIGRDRALAGPSRPGASPAPRALARWRLATTGRVTETIGVGVQATDRKQA